MIVLLITSMSKNYEKQLDLIMKMIIHVTESVQGLSSQLVNIVLQSLFPINDEFCFKEKENVVLAFSPFNNNTSNA